MTKLLSTHHSLIHVEPNQNDSLTVADFFTNKFDYVVKADMYKEQKNTLAVYDMYRQIMSDTKRQIKTPIITLSPDTAISGSTLAGAAEKFMYGEPDKKTGNPCFRTQLKVIYIDTSPDMSTKKYVHYSDFSNSVLADVMGVTDSTFTLHRIDIPPENIYLVGIDETSLNDDQDGFIRKHNIKMFSLQTMIKKGVVNIMKYIVDECKFDDVHVIIDLSCMQTQYTPSVYRSNDGKNGFDFDQMTIIAQSLKQLDRLNGVDITGYNFGLIKDKEKHHIANMLTIKTIEMITSSLICLKQKSINIFNEESRFLIWKRLDDEDLLGWLILRGMSLQEREDMITQIGDDRIITISCENDDCNGDDDCNDNGNGDDNAKIYDAFVTVTTLKEQQEKSYYCAKTIYDCCLYPGEKLNMMFELLNTPNTQDILTKQSLKTTTNITASDAIVPEQACSENTNLHKLVSRFTEPIKYAEHFLKDQILMPNIGTEPNQHIDKDVINVAQNLVPMIKIDMIDNNDEFDICSIYDHIYGKD